VPTPRALKVGPGLVIWHREALMILVCSLRLDWELRSLHPASALTGMTPFTIRRPRIIKTA
jgi:hypothetical protein